MGFDNKYPYTDFHELNLDWFLQEFNKLLNEWADLAADNAEFKQTMTERFGTLSDTVHEFTTFVTNYFDNLDVQQEINNKLNDMVEDGTLSELLRPYFNMFTVEINARMRNQDDKISVLEGRMDTFTHLTQGSTSGDAELQDIRVGYNGETYNTAGNAVRAQVSDIHDELDGIENALTITTAISVDYEDLEQGAFNNSGKLISWLRIRTKDPVKVNKGTLLEFDIGSLYVIAWELSTDSTSGGNVIAQSGTWQQIPEYEIQNDCYLMLTFANGPSEASSTQITPPDFSTYEVTSECVSNDVETLKTKVNAMYPVYEDVKEKGLTSDNLEYTETVYTESSTEFTGNKLLNASGSVVNYADHPNDVVSDYIDISSYEKVYITANGTFGNGCFALYDTDYNVISVPLKANAGPTRTFFTKEEVIIPSNAKYGIVAGYKETYTLSVEHISGYKQELFKNLKWCCLGDSLTERNNKTSKNYADYIIENTGIQFVNKGLSGSGYKRRYDLNEAFYQRVSSIPTDCDVVTIFGSGNDQEYFATAMGTATDTGTDTLGGCINTTIDNLYAIMPTVQLGIIAPTPWADYNPANTNNGMARYVNLLKTICEYRSIPFLDLYHESNLRPWDSDFLPYAYSHDEGGGVHPDETGHKLFAGRIRSFLESLIGTF